MSFTDENLIGRRDLVRRVFALAGLDLGDGKTRGAELRLCCPFHNDGDSHSLDVNIGKAAYLCRSCGVGGDAVDFYARRLNLTPERAIAELREKLDLPRRWEIRDATGTLKATHLFTGRDEHGKKRMPWEPSKGVKPATLPLYGSERLAKDPAADVIVTEGEKAADALLDRGLVAVGTVTGAKHTPDAAALEVLRGRDVTLWPDFDKDGRKHMEIIGAALQGVAASVRVFEWGEQEKDDAADFFARGGEPERLAIMLEGARPFEPAPTAEPSEPPEPEPSGATPYDVLANTPPPGERMAVGIRTLDKASRGGLARGRVYTVVGPPSIGKTALAIQLGRTLVRKHGAFVVGLFADEGSWSAAVMLAEGEGFDRTELENAFPNMASEAHDRLRSIPFLMPDPDGADGHLEAIEKKWLARAPAGARLAVIVDSVQKGRIGPGVVVETPKQQADLAMSWARSLSRRLNAVVILTAKANRASWAKKNPSENTNPLAAGLDSSSIEYDSDAFFFLSGDPAEKVFLTVWKNRPGDGSKPRIALGFDRARASFHEIDQDEAEAQAEEAAREKREAAWSKDEKRVLDGLRRFPDQAQGKLAKMVGMRDATLGAVLIELERKGTAVCRNVGKAHFWKLAISSREGGES